MLVLRTPGRLVWTLDPCEGEVHSSRAGAGRVGSVAGARRDAAGVARRDAGADGGLPVHGAHSGAAERRGRSPADGARLQPRGAGGAVSADRARVGSDSCALLSQIFVLHWQWLFLS